MAKNLILWLIIAAVLVTVMNNFSTTAEPRTMNYTEFLELVNDRQVERVTVDGFVITGKRRDGETFKTVRPAIQDRSEEHTSELQSRPHLVCRLLLEKKK